jgi:hypothetical protein
MRFGSGEYWTSSSDGLPDPILHARIAFILAVDDALPACSEELGTALELLPPRAACRAVREAVESWQMRWNLTDGWCADEMLSGLGRRGRRALACLQRTAPQHRKAAPEELPSTQFRFSYAPIDLSTTTLDESRDMISEAFRARLSDWADQNEARAKSMKWKRTPALRGLTLRPLNALLSRLEVKEPSASAAREAVLERHLYWLARYQCGRETHSAISMHRTGCLQRHRALQRSRA